MTETYTMEDIYGDTVTITVNDDGTASVEAPDYEGGTVTRIFEDEDHAYAWAYNHGFRD